MKRSSLIAAALIVLVANAFALVHAWRNRSGAVSAHIVLTERELPLSVSAGEDDSSVELNLIWRSYDRPWNDSADWLGAAKLAELGFDTHVSPSSAGAPEFYQRERPRRAFVALEYNGPAWQRELASLNKQADDHPELASPRPDPDKLSRLLPIDASLDPAKLRAAHRDSSNVILIPAA
ncbi:MAG TPA: DUF4824 family protein, partial [Bryobacteraceae bacterium]|nr:DUF4824 family protein [Bryobacteraceae bacterium]